MCFFLKDYIILYTSFVFHVNTTNYLYIISLQIGRIFFPNYLVVFLSSEFIL